MIYVNKISSLEEMSLVQVAINFCQDNGLKEIALQLEKPTYGTIFVSDPDKPPILADMKAKRKETCYLDDPEKVRLWDAAIEEQCQRLLEGLPSVWRHSVHIWIHRIALEYLGYSRRQEAFFGVSRYFFMSVLTREHWTIAGRLDEEKLALQFLQDEQLTVLQRYRIACVYCLHVHIPKLWMRLTQEETQLTKCPKEINKLVLLWSRHMNREDEEIEELQTNHLWTNLAYAAMLCNPATVVLCWKKLKEHIKGKIIIDITLYAVRKWANLSHFFLSYKEKLARSKYCLWTNNIPLCNIVKFFNLPSYYSELMCFFLSEMDEEQQLTFFKKAFQSKKSDRVIECFLDWPHQVDFLRTINRLWGIIPKEKYGKFLFILVCKYIGTDENKNCYYDYRSLLGMLWEKTPKEYREYMFTFTSMFRRMNWSSCFGYELLTRLLGRSHFQREDETLFKHVFRYVPPEKRRSWISLGNQIAQNIRALLMQKKKWPFVNWLLETSLPNEEIPSFKKEFIQSCSGFSLCLYELEENRESFVEDLIDWSFVSFTEKERFKCALREKCLKAFEKLLSTGALHKVEGLINFCISWDEKKKRFKSGFERSVNAEKEIRYLKKNLFSGVGINVHYALVFERGDQREVEPFYKFFDLSPEEIKKLKNDTLFSDQVTHHIRKVIFELDMYRVKSGMIGGLDKKCFVASLCWCLTDEETVIGFTSKLYTSCQNCGVDKQRDLDNLMSELLFHFRKQEVQDETSGEGFLVESKGGKRSEAIEDESSTAGKRCKLWSPGST